MNFIYNISIPLPQKSHSFWGRESSYLNRILRWYLPMDTAGQTDTHPLKYLPKAKEVKQGVQYGMGTSGREESTPACSLVPTQLSSTFGARKWLSQAKYCSKSFLWKFYLVIRSVPNDVFSTEQLWLWILYITPHHGAKAAHLKPNEFYNNEIKLKLNLIMSTKNTRLI